MRTAPEVIINYNVIIIIINKFNSLGYMHYVKKRPAVFLLAYVGTKKVAQLSANVAELGLSQTAAKQPSQDDRLRITVVTDLIY